MTIPVLSAADVEGGLTWLAVAEAIRAGHARPKAKLGDQFLSRGSDIMLSRSAWVDGMGIAVKTVTAMPGNPERGLPLIHGAMVILDDTTGQVEAVIDSALVTKWKTAGDSLLGAMCLARKDAARMVILGAGVVAQSLIEAYRAAFPDLDIGVWNRTRARAEALAEEAGVRVIQDLPVAVAEADIVSCATMSKTPVLEGAWLKPGAHVDLIGAFNAEMREADDAVLTRGRIFVDSRDTTMDHIGELKIPLAEGTIAPKDVIGDFYEMCSGTETRQSEDEITVFKNGGGAHMDLMTGRLILEVWRQRASSRAL